MGYLLWGAVTWTPYHNITKVGRQVEEIKPEICCEFCVSNKWGKDVVHLEGRLNNEKECRGGVGGAVLFEVTKELERWFSNRRKFTV